MAQEDLARRLVKVGMTDHVFVDPRTRKPATVQVEKFYDLRHPSRFYIRAVGDTFFEPMFETRRKDPAPEPLAPTTGRRLGRPEGSHDPAPSVPPPVRYQGQLRRPQASAYPTTAFAD